MSLRLSDLARMPQQQSTAALGQLVRDAKAPRNGQAKGIDARIRELEIRYDMTSAQMLEKHRHGELRDTAAVARWLVLLSGR